MTDAILARYREVFTLSPSGAILWRDRSAADFVARFNLPQDYAQDLARSWAQKQAGQPPVWRKTGAGDLVVNVDRTPARLKDICRALGADFKTAQAAATARHDQAKQDLTRSAVLRLVRLDHQDRLVWRKRTQENAPKTAPIKREEFNRVYAGRALPVHADGSIKIQRQTVKAAQARAWLAEAAQQDKTSEEKMPEDLTPEIVHGWKKAGKTEQEMLAAMKAMGWDDLPDSALSDILAQYFK